MRKILAILLVALVLVSPSWHLQALALSDVQLNSTLNQVLDARVLLLAIDVDELSSLQVRINESEKNATGLGSLSLQTEIKEDENGHYIRITSRDVIREPVLSFSLELNWTKGRLIREYSLLIDPR